MSDLAAGRAGRPLAGFSIGILVLDTQHVLIQGNVQHAASFEFPVLYQVVRGVGAAALMRGDSSAGDAIVAGAQILEASGVDAIVGACGSFGHYQQRVAGAVNIPVFMSILLEVPLLLRALPKTGELGVLFASAQSFTDLIRAQCGIESTERIIALGADTLGTFRPILAQERKLDSPALASEIVALTQRTLRDHPRIGAWLLQCSDLPPYAADIQRATQRPVFDMISLIRHVHDACNRR